MRSRRSERAQDRVSGRREFLKAGAATVFGGSCLAVGLAAARATAAATGRPVFSEASFNELMRNAQASGQIKQMAAEARRDLKGWLLQSFTLTPVQVQQIQSLPPQTVQQIAQVLAPVAEKGAAIQMTLREERRPGSARKRSEAKTPRQEAERLEEAADPWNKVFTLSAKGADRAAMNTSWTIGMVRQLAP